MNAKQAWKFWEPEVVPPKVEYTMVYEINKHGKLVCQKTKEEYLKCLQDEVRFREEMMARQ